MTTLAQIRDVVTRKSQDPDSTARSAAVYDYEINRSIRYYSNYRFWFNDDVEDLATTANNQVLSGVPDNISELLVNGIMVIDDQVKVDLIKLLPDNFFNRDDDQTGRPYYYTVRKDEILLLPTPDQAYPVKFRYLKKYADLVNDTDTNDFTNNAQDLIVMRTLKNLYAEDKQSPEFLATYDAMEKQELKALRERTDNRLQSGTLTVNSILEESYY